MANAQDIAKMFLTSYYDAANSKRDLLQNFYVCIYVSVLMLQFIILFSIFCFIYENLMYKYLES